MSSSSSLPPNGQNHERPLSVLELTISFARSEPHATMRNAVAASKTIRMLLPMLMRAVARHDPNVSRAPHEPIPLVGLYTCAVARAQRQACAHHLPAAALRIGR